MSTLSSELALESLSYEDILRQFQAIFYLKGSLHDWLQDRDDTFFDLHKRVEGAQESFLLVDDSDELLESEPFVKVLEAFAYQELYFQQQLNENIKRVWLSSAEKTSLDRLARLFAVSRNQDSSGKLESDIVIKARLKQSLQTFNTAGSRDAYLQHAMQVSYQHPDYLEKVKAIAVHAPDDQPGTVNVTVLSDRSSGQPSSELLKAVGEKINHDDVRPITDFVAIKPAIIRPFLIRAHIITIDPIFAEEVRLNVVMALQDYVRDVHSLGNEIAVSALYKALHQEGVKKAELFEPMRDLISEIDESYYCNGDINDVDFAIKVTRDSAYPPQYMPLALAFVSFQGAIDVIARLHVVPAADERTIDDYVVYWAQQMDGYLERIAIIPGGIIAQTGGDFYVNFLASWSIPVGVTHVMVVSRNDIGEMANGLAVLLELLHPATRIAFEDVNLSQDLLSGELVITPAGDETSLIGYYLYWAQQENDQLMLLNEPAIATFEKTGLAIHYMVSDLTPPSQATHWLVLSFNQYGQSSQGVSLLLSDGTLPIAAAAAIEFVDVNPNGGYIGGDIIIHAAVDESTIDEYILYWGMLDRFGEVIRLPGSLSIERFLAQDVAIYQHALAYATLIPPGATHFLVRSSNNFGEGVEMANVIDVRAVPTHAALDIVLNNISLTETTINERLMRVISADLAIRSASDEADIKAYVVYWGKKINEQGAVVKLRDKEGVLFEPIIILEKIGNDLSFFLDQMVVPSQATHVMVMTRNQDGDMLFGIRHAIPGVG